MDMQNNIFKRINSGYKHFKSLLKKTIVPISKHVEWCRWLYGGSGYRMLLFAVIIAILFPVLISILGYCVAVGANDLLGNHNKDIGYNVPIPQDLVYVIEKVDGKYREVRMVDSEFWQSEFWSVKR